MVTIDKCKVKASTISIVGTLAKLPVGQYQSQGTAEHKDVTNVKVEAQRGITGVIGGSSSGRLVDNGR